MKLRSMFTTKVQHYLLLAAVVFLSIAAWYVSHRNGVVLAYNDSMSHLNMARLVIDNKNPGIAQIGSVWLPLSHLLSLPFIWIDWAWRTGFAGSIVSMLAYVGTVVGIYGIIRELTARRIAAYVGAAAAAVNVNLLYLQSTPLTEPLYVGLFVGSVYFLIRYLKTSEPKYLLPLAFITALQVATRYDGWFVGAMMAVIILGYDWFVRDQGFKKAFGSVLLYVLPVAFAGMMWIGWNAAIYGDPLYFATGPFSAQAQQEVIEEQKGLETKGDVLIASQAVGYSALENVGLVTGIIAIIGWIIVIASSGKQYALMIIGFFVLSSVVFFNILALYLGFSILTMPELQFASSASPVEAMFNVRYGILMLPLAAVGVGMFVASYSRSMARYAVPMVLAAIVLQGTITLLDTPITLQDGQVGASAFRQQRVSKHLDKHINESDDVLMSMSFFSPVAHASTLPLKQFIHEGAGEEWTVSTKDPSRYAEWIVMSNGNRVDPVYRHLVEENNSSFLDRYTLQYEDRFAKVYQLSDKTAQRTEQ